MADQRCATDTVSLFLTDATRREQPSGAAPVLPSPAPPMQSIATRLGPVTEAEAEAEAEARLPEQSRSARQAPQQQLTLLSAKPFQLPL